MPPAEAVAMPQATQAPITNTIVRIDVQPLAIQSPDPAQALPEIGTMTGWPVYWFAASAPVPSDFYHTIARALLVDPVLESEQISSNELAMPLPSSHQARWLVQKQFLPGVTDNLAKTVKTSVGLLFPDLPTEAVQVASGHAWHLTTELSDPETIAEKLAYQLYNPLIEKLWVLPAAAAHTHPAWLAFPQVPTTGRPAAEVVPLDGPDADLLKLSQSRCLALTLDEMHYIRNYYQRPTVQSQRSSHGLPLWPTDVELEILAQTWSEHCKHKIFAANIEFTDGSQPEYPTTTTIDSLFKTYIAGATQQLSAERPDLLSVFKDNAGVVRWNDRWGVCFKVETHNSPSALEPYGGALTGIVGVNRDILGTGLGAMPMFNTDVFCFAHPEEPHANRPGMLPPEAILTGVRKGVEDGGNKSGIPTVNGAIYFDARYRAKPLVFCGTGGLLPLDVGGKPGYGKFTQPGDTIVMAGGRVGKDGIHGATFSSEALHEASPVSSVQIGDPLTQKRLSDFMKAAQAADLLTGLTDNGAGGLSSSVGEMAEQTNGATIHLERVPLKYPGLKPYEIVISESQERMTFSTRQFEALKSLANHYDVEVANIGTFHDQGTFDILDHGQPVASLPLDFLHHGLPQMQLKAVWERQKSQTISGPPPVNPSDTLLRLLARPNICSREVLIRQYDHEVQGRSVIKPLMGPAQTSPCDAAVLLPELDGQAGLVVSNGLCPGLSDWDPYKMAACAMDEAVRNAVAVGADPASLTLLDNFCWPDPLPSPRNPDAEHKLGQLVRACQALHDLALVYRMPFISGKDSMKNDYDDGTLRLSIPPTLLVSAMGKIPDIEKAVTSDFKAPGDAIYLLGATHVHMGGSEYHRLLGWHSPYCPTVNGRQAIALYRALHQAIMNGWIRSCHDLSEGGLAIALAESVIGSPYGAGVSLEAMVEDSPELRWDDALFCESPSRFVVSVSPEHEPPLAALFTDLPWLPLGHVSEAATLQVTSPQGKILIDAPRDALAKAWQRSPAACWDEPSQANQGGSHHG